ncbi:hypothetical protein LCGC14_2551970, partial [marine sediment metagenome]
MPEITDGQLERTILALRWMTTQLQWQYNENRTAFAQTNKGGYSDELIDALDLLFELEAKQGSDGREVPTY